MNDRTILITGVTGKQGGAVARALEGAEFNLRGLTRKPNSGPAAALAQMGASIPTGSYQNGQRSATLTPNVLAEKG